MRLTIHIDDKDARLIAQVFSQIEAGGLNTHGRLDMRRLAGMLLEDVALAVRRPGSWEGANMQQALRSHGYSV